MLQKQLHKFIIIHKPYPLMWYASVKDTILISDSQLK